MTFGQSVRAVWNGPFNAGPLVRPVSVGDTLAKVLEVLWKAVVAGAAGIAAVFAVAVAWPILTKKTEVVLADKVGISVALDRAACSNPEHPMKVSTYNKSKVTIGRITFHVGVREMNRSTDINAEGVDYYSDAVLLPDYWQVSCYPFPESVRNAPKEPLSVALEVKSAEAYDGPYSGPLPPGMGDGPPVVHVQSGR